LPKEQDQPDDQSDTDSEGISERGFPERDRISADEFWNTVDEFDPSFKISDRCDDLPADHFERWKNNKGRYIGTYVKQGKGHKEINKLWSVDSVYKYADWATGLVPRIRTDGKDPQDRFLPFQSVTECVQTLAQMCQHPQAAFGWISPKLAYIRTMEEAWERLPPQTEFVLLNGKPMPMHLLQPEKPEHGTDKQRYYDRRTNRAYVLHDDVVRKYHGTDFHSFLSIARDGLFPSPSSTGREAMLSTFGIAPPMVYVADHWGLAFTYPMHETTVGMLPGEKQWKAGVHAGTVVSMQPTNPVRIVLELLCRNKHRFWHKPDKWNSQSAYPAGCFYIRGVFIVGVYPDLIPRSYPFVGSQPLQRDMYQSCKRVLNPRFVCADTRTEINPEAISRLLKHPGCDPYFPRSLQAEGGFPDGTPEIWTNDFIDQLCRHPGAHFQIHLMTRHAAPWIATGAWDTLEVNDLTEVLMEDHSYRTMPRDEMWRKNGVAYHWHRQVKGVNQRMPDQSDYPLIATFRLATVEIKLSELLAMNVIPSEELLRLSSANQGTYDGVLAISARYNWATRLRQVRTSDPEDPEYLVAPTGEGGFPEAGVGVTIAPAGSTAAAAADAPYRTGG